MYWCYGCLFPLLVYDRVFDIGKTYPSSFNWIERLLLGLGLLTVWMGFMWLVFIARDSSRRYSRLDFLRPPAEIADQPTPTDGLFILPAELD
jgi:hypothetical protein